MIPFLPDSTSVILRSKVIFSFSIESLDLLSDADDLKQGYNEWKLRGHIKEMYKGRLERGLASSFETTVSIYEGPVLSRPLGLWINHNPNIGETWVAFCGAEVQSEHVEDILGGTGLSGVSVFKWAEVEKDIKSAQKRFSREMNLDQKALENMLVKHICEKNLLSDLQPYFGKRKIMGIADPATAAEVADNYKRLGELWTQGFLPHREEIIPLFKKVLKKDPAFVFNSSTIIEKTAGCKGLQNIEYPEQDIETVLQIIMENER